MNVNGAVIVPGLILLGLCIFFYSRWQGEKTARYHWEIIAQESLRMNGVTPEMPAVGIEWPDFHSYAERQQERFTEFRQWIEGLHRRHEDYVPIA